MFSIWGIVSTPSGRFGFGRDPGLRTTAGVAFVVLVAAPDEADPLLDELDDEQPAASSPIAAAAPSAAIPFRSERRESEES